LSYATRPVDVPADIAMNAFLLLRILILMGKYLQEARDDLGHHHPYRVPELAFRHLA
jgi:hypothetical protein